MRDMTTEGISPTLLKKYVKKPIPIQAVQIHEPFVVDTLEGRHTGNAGDYLVIGIRGERYPVKKDIFEESYVEKED